MTENARIEPPRAEIADRVRVEGGATIYISGQVALGPDMVVLFPDDIAAQTEFVFSAIASILEAEGGTMGDLVKITTFLTDMGDLAEVRRIRSGFLSATKPPASTTVQVVALARPGLRIEVEAVAVIP